MSTLQEIETAIELLPREDLLKLTDWISSRFSDAWDCRIEVDISSGRLQGLADEAIAEYRSGKTTPFPGDE
jgi:hypothetical protein